MSAEIETTSSAAMSRILPSLAARISVYVSIITSIVNVMTTAIPISEPFLPKKKTDQRRP